MKRFFVLAFVLTSVASVAYAGSASITLTAPQVTSITIGGTTYTSAADLANLNNQLTSQFATIQTDLNNNYFSKFHDETDLASGFSNISSATFNNATVDSFQNYDLVSVMLGWNIGAAGFSPNPFSLDSQVNSKVNDITNTGDTYMGVGTGGFAGQVGLNAGFLVKNLYLSAKFGFFPSTTLGSDNKVTFQQVMFGLGANYKLFDKIDVLAGLLTWRGLSLGSGVIYNGSTTTVDITVSDQSQPFTASVGGGAAQNYTATMSNIRAKLNITNSSVVIPIDLSTSIEAFWLLNVGLGAGVDVAFSGSKISLGAASDIGVTGLGNNAQFNPGSAVVTATDTNGNGDIFLPKVFGSLGMNFTIVKLDVPITYYPTTQTYVFGINIGAVW